MFGDAGVNPDFRGYIGVLGRISSRSKSVPYLKVSRETEPDQDVSSSSMKLSFLELLLKVAAGLLKLLKSGVRNSRISSYLLELEVSELLDPLRKEE